MTAAAHSAALDEMALQVINPYIGIVIVLLILAFWISRANLPEVKGDEEESIDHPGSTATDKTSVFQFPHVILGFIALFLYVGVEVLAGDSIIAYGKSQGIALNTAKYFTTGTMVSMVLGYIIGIIAIPKYIKQDVAMKICALSGIIFTLAIIFTSGYTSVAFVALLGLSNSLVWPAIWPLALKGVGKFTNAASSLLVMGIAGGAVIPLSYGGLAEIIGSQQAYWVAIPCYIFILYYAIAGHKIGKG